ncbi:reverse transcriptase domain-containing protein [Tanacetum coccineum]
MVRWGHRGGGGSGGESVVVMERVRGGAWFGGSGRSGDREAFGTWSENSPEKFFCGGDGGRNLAGGDYRENWERREKFPYSVKGNNTVLHDNNVPYDNTILHNNTVPYDNTVLHDNIVPHDNIVLHDNNVLHDNIVLYDNNVLHDNCPCNANISIMITCIQLLHFKPMNFTQPLC